MSATQTDILLVDDSLEDVELTTQILQREKLAANIHVVRDGEDALDFLFCRGAFTERSFDRHPKVVLLDLELPKVNGIQVLEQLRNDLRTKFIPVVVLSSSNEERDLARSYELGANSYIQKPNGLRRTPVHSENRGLVLVGDQPTSPSPHEPGP
ncbi:MAG: response regulator [Terriglobales bacterium]